MSKASEIQIVEVEGTHYRNVVCATYVDWHHI